MIFNKVNPQIVREISLQMKIDSLTIGNFKCFKSEKTFDFGRITVLTGANSSGKSSVSYAILMILQSEGFPKSLSTNGEYINLGDFEDIANKHDSTNTINLSFKITSSKERVDTFNTSWEIDKTNFLPNLKNQNTKIDSNTQNARGKGRPISIFNFGKNNVNFIGAFRLQPQRTNLEKNKADFKIEKDGDGYLDQIVEWEKRGNGKIKELVRVMKELDLIEQIQIKRLSGGRFEVLVKPTNSAMLTSLANVGFGVSQFLPIIVADLQLPNDSTLFLAEPEIHLHPSIQSKFGDYIVNQVNTTEKNYIIETHSEYFLNKLRLAIVRGELKKEDIKVYFLENNGEDTDVYDIDFKKNGAIKNAPKGFFETYSIDVMDIALNAFAE